MLGEHPGGEGAVAVEGREDAQAALTHLDLSALGAQAPSDACQRDTEVDGESRRAGFDVVGPLRRVR